MVAAGLGNCGQDLGVDFYPGADHWHHGRLKHVYPTSDARGEDVLQLGEGAEGGFLDARDGSSGSCQQAHGDSNGFVVVEEKGRDVGAGPELVTTEWPWRGSHRIAQLAQAIDVPAKGPFGDLETVEEFMTGPGT